MPKLSCLLLSSFQKAFFSAPAFARFLHQKRSQHHQQHYHKSWLKKKQIWQTVTVPACLSSRPPAANRRPGRRGLRLLRACSELLVYILNETANEAFAFMLCCAPLTALTASEGKFDWRLGIVGVTLCHTASAFGRGGGCLHRKEVSQAVVDGGRVRQEEIESSFQSFWIFHEGILQRQASWMDWEKDLVLRCALSRQTEGPREKQGEWPRAEACTGRGEAWVKSRIKKRNSPLYLQVKHL